jgi:4-aminobutyrate aminotransferase-like enzyme
VKLINHPSVVQNPLICIIQIKRENLVQNASTHVQRIQKALTMMNLQLHKVISDITGVTGINILTAIINGERNPDKLAKLADRRIDASKVVKKKLPML